MDHRQVFSELILPLKNSLYRYGYSFLRDRQKAEDIVQETMLRLWNCRDKWEQLDNIEGYSLGIVRHLCIDEIRKNKFKYAEVMVLENERSYISNPGQSLSEKELNQFLGKILLNLPEKQRLCFHLRENDGRSYDEISKISGMTMDQVKVNIFRARNYIKNKILKEDSYGIQ